MTATRSVQPAPLADASATGSSAATRRDLLWLAAIWLAAVIYFHTVLVGGQSLYFRDTVDIYYPQATFTSDALREGRLPLWEPKIGLGYPFQADPHSMVFYPLTVLLLLLPFPLAYNIFTVVHVPLAGTFLWLLLRRWGLSAASSATGACVLMFCGFTIGCTCLTTLLRGLTWAPLAMLAFDRFLSGGGTRAVAWTALVLAIQGSGTDPQYVFFTAIVLALLPFMNPIASPACSRMRAWVGWSSACTLAGLVIAYQYLPLAQLISASNRVGGLGAGEHTLFSVHPANLINMVLPVPFPDPASTQFLTSFQGGELPLLPDMYWGLPVLALALTSLGFLACPGKRGQMAAVALGLAAVCLILALGGFTPLYGILTTLLPPLTAFRYPSKYVLLTTLGLAIAAAVGTEGLLGRVQPCKQIYKRCLEVMMALLLVALAVVALTKTSLPEAFLTERIWEKLSPTLGPLPLMLRRSWLSDGAFALGLLAAARVALALAARAKLDHGLAVAVVLLLSVGDLACGTYRSFPTIQNDFLSSVPKAVEWVGRPAPGAPPTRYASLVLKRIQFDHERTVLQQFLLERELLHHSWGALHSLEPVLSHMSVRLASELRLEGLFSGLSRQTRNRLFAAIGVQAVVRPSLPTRVPTERIVGRYGPLEVQSLDGVVPRAFVASRAHPVPPDVELPSIDALLALPEDAAFEAADSGPATFGPTAVKECRITSYATDSLRVDFELEGRGLLVVLDQFYPGWEARVDGRPRPIRKVCGLFRGVEVSGGERRLEMFYRPLSFRLGGAISLGALALLAGLLLRPLLARPGARGPQ
ncbi:MAG: hypothetical protein HY814_04720 [Candidatus Riflebacteria bacterium]|nr:hypothetical protein [Candidatus Riflebacteria bacterium]